MGKCEYREGDCICRLENNHPGNHICNGDGEPHYIDPKPSEVCYEPLGGVYGAALFRDLGDGRGVWVLPQIYTFKLVIGPIGEPFYTDAWCYKNLATVVTAFSEWNPLEDAEPTGWVRHPPSGRRRFPDGDPASEEVRR